MKFIDYLYINIFASSYRNGFHNKRVDPNSFASIVLGISLGGWFMSAIIFYYKIHFNVFPNSNLKYLTIFAPLLVFLFPDKKKFKILKNAVVGVFSVGFVARHHQQQY